jgi:hypothetical protein
MKASLYSMTIPVFMRSLTNLANILEKAEHHAGETKFDLDHLLSDRLYPDMLPFTRQVQVACDTSKFAASRLSGVEAPSFSDDEKTTHELIARIRKTVEFLKSVSPDHYAGAEEKEVSLPYFPGKVFDGFTYTTEYALPNFFFHVTIAYALLRHNGVPLGKSDYLGSLTFRDKAA